MGCDIHLVLEKQVKVRGLFRWVGVNAFPYMLSTVYNRKGDEYVTTTGNTHYPVRDRNYDLFATLAGVRGEGPKPRGLPDDASDLTIMESDLWGEDGHSHTWMLMSEALPIFVMHGQFGPASQAVLSAFKGGTDRALLGYMEHFWSLDREDETLDDYRLCMWFDN